MDGSEPIGRRIVFTALLSPVPHSEVFPEISIFKIKFRLCILFFVLKICELFVSPLSIVIWSLFCMFSLILLLYLSWASFQSWKPNRHFKNNGMYTRWVCLEDCRWMGTVLLRGSWELTAEDGKSRLMFIPCWKINCRRRWKLPNLMSNLADKTGCQATADQQQAHCLRTNFFVPEHYI